MRATGRARTDTVDIEIVLSIASLTNFKTVDFRKKEKNNNE